MLNNATGFRKVYIACGYTDLRFGIDGLAGMVKEQFKLDPFTPGILFLFCGRRCDRIKGLLWEEDGFLLLYKRLEAGRFQWSGAIMRPKISQPNSIPGSCRGLPSSRKKSFLRLHPHLHYDFCAIRRK